MLAQSSQKHFKKKVILTLAGVAQWIECQPVNQRVPDSIPVRTQACVACRVPSRARARDNHSLMLLFLSFSLPSPLSKNS